MGKTVITTAHSTAGTAVSLESNGAHWQADLDPESGGGGQLPDPHQLLDSALAACTTLTMQLYAKRKGYPLGDVEVKIERTEGGGVYRMHRLVNIGGALSEDQRKDLLRVANACPIHRSLTSKFEIETELVPAP